MPERDGKQLKVLVVDDTATNRQILQVFLKKLGFLVIAAENGAEAVVKFQAEQPDLILMDVMMPVMDGYEATRRIKESCSRWVPVVFLSALDKEENLVAGLDAGGDDYLSKPVNFVILDAKLRSLMRTLDLQRQLDEQSKRIAAITDNLVDGVVNIDELGTIHWCNPAIESIFGYPPTTLLGQNIKVLMPEPYHSQHDGYLARYAATGVANILGRGQRLVRGMRRNGEEFPLEVGVSDMHVNGKRQYVGVMRDVSERVRAEKELQDNAQRLQVYHDAQESQNKLAENIVKRQMMRHELADPHVHHWVAPADNFSGDIVAAVRSANGDLYVMLADATGHGLGAAICTLPVLSVFYSLAESGAGLAWIITEINRQLKATMPIGRFVAATVICIDHRRSDAEVWVGGTPDLLLIDENGAVKRSISANHLPLGIDDLSAEEAAPQRIAFSPTDQFVMFSDGVVEATNATEQEFGFGQMRAALASAPRHQRVAAVTEALKRHVGSGTPHDDISLLVIDCGEVA